MHKTRNMPKKVNKEEVINRFISVHGDKYDYSKVDYVKMHKNVTIICPEHGEFQMSPHSHIFGQGCPKCGIAKRTMKKRDNRDTFIKKAILVHGDKYDYSKVEYIDSQTKVCVICPEHGEFLIRPYSHLQGNGCRKCYDKQTSDRKKDTTEKFIEKAKKIHGDKYDYSKVSYTSSNEEVCLICPKHGEFWQKPNHHLQGSGCPKCSLERPCMTTEEWIKKAILVHGDKYDYSKTEYKSPHSLVTITCPVHGDFKQRATYHLSGNGCQKCAVRNSKFEDEVYEFISELEENAVKHDRDVLGSMEIDIYLPEKSIGFECDGLFWHSEVKKDKNYHINKTNLCAEKSVRLIHIFEDEWVHKRDIVKSRIRDIIGKGIKRIYARKCELREVNNSDSLKFLEANHIQGKLISKYRYGLYYDNQLVSLMTFGSMRKNLGSKNSEGTYEMLRFCNKLNTTVVGGASKLLKHFIKTVCPEKIVSYCDLRWSQGGLYEKLGFKLKHVSQPSYFYIIGDKRENRFKYRKDVLVKEGFDRFKTEHQIMLDRKIYRIYDCGCKVYYMDLV